MPNPAGELVARRASTSLAWKWFGFHESDVRQSTVICKLCRKSVPVKCSSTTNLFHHLRTHHANTYGEYLRLRGGPAPPAETETAREPAALRRSPDRHAPYDRASRRWQSITSAITHLIAKEMLASHVVESDGFRRLLGVLDPKYKVPSRAYFSQTALPGLYESNRAALTEELRGASHFSASVDVWSSRSSGPYLSLTAHLIDEAWRLRSYCLHTSYCPQEHAADIIALGLKDALAAWALREEHLACVTAHSCPNVITALRVNGWTRLPCLGHRLHLAIERSMCDPRVECAIGACKKVLGAFSNSWRMKKALSDAQGELKLPGHKLIIETPSEWGSRQRMIDRFLEQESAIRHVLDADRKRSHLMPTRQDFEALQSVSKALGPLLEFTDALSGEQVVTVSYLKPVLVLFNTEVLAVKCDDTDLTKTIKETILDCLNTQYKEDNVDDLLSLASMLDPRFKTRYNDHQQVEATSAEITTELLAMELEEHCTPPGSSAAPVQGPTAEGAAGGEDSEEPPKKPRRSFRCYFKKQDAKASLANAVEIELQSYLGIPEVDSDVNPLEWWQLQEMNFPRLAKLARKYLCISAMSRPSGRAFTTGGSVVTCQRDSLKPDAMDKLVFLAHNLK